MSFLTEDDLKRQIKSGQFDRLYLIFGNEDYLKQFYALQIPKKSVDEAFADFNLHRLDGKETSLNEISDCTSAYPMMGEYTCTLVKDFPLQTMSGDRGKINESFMELVENLPETSILVFWMDSTEVDEKNTKWSKIIKYIDSNGVCAKIEKRSSNALCKLLCDSASKKDCTLSKDNALYMVTLVGDDMSTLRNELDKVCSFVGSGDITKSAIDKTVIVSVEAKVFSLSRFIVNKDADKAFETLSNLFKLREEPVAILGVLSKAYVDMYRVKAIKEKGLRADSLSDYFPSAYKGRGFIITNAARDGASLSLTQLHKALLALGDADRRLKSTGEDAKTVLEELVLRLIRI